MTQDEIIELAIQGHASTRDAIHWAMNQERERMTVVAMNAAEKAVDVAIKLEREACAKLLETTDLGGLKDNPAMQSWVAEMLLAYVKAIRARGQA